MSLVAVVGKEKVEEVGFALAAGCAVPNAKDGVVPLLNVSRGFAAKDKAGVELVAEEDVAGEEPKLKPVSGLPKPKDDFAAGAPKAAALAPPNASCGVEPPGPNLPRPAGGEAA